jgi:hypothetical protein
VVIFRVNLQIKFAITLSDYFEKISSGNFDFLPSFDDCCPICHAKNCAVRIGFYFRIAVDFETGLIIEALPIVRFLCKRKGKPRIKDRTFSLLPSVLIPYRRLSIKSLMIIVREKLAAMQRVIEIPGKIINYFAPEAVFSFETCYIYNYLKIFKNTVSKLNIFLRKNLKQDVHLTTTTREGLVFAYNFIEKYIDLKTNEKGANAIDWYYYTKSGGFLKNSQFLFGTPYQHR